MSEVIVPVKNRKPKKASKKKTCPEPEPQPSRMTCEDIGPPMFPNVLQPFPEEGIAGMYPIQSTCRREVAEHMLKFQQRLEEEYARKSRPNLEARLIDFKNVNPLDEAYDRLIREICLLQSEIEEFRHEMAVDAIKKKYRTHDPNCPCYVEDS